jgi:ankyrin repeat protein
MASMVIRLERDRSLCAIIAADDTRRLGVLLDAGLDVNHRLFDDSGVRGPTLLEQAAEIKRLATMDALLGRKADVHLVNISRCGNALALERLVKGNFDVTRVNEDGMSSLSSVVLFSQLRLGADFDKAVRVLLDAKADAGFRLPRGCYAGQTVAAMALGLSDNRPAYQSIALMLLAASNNNAAQQGRDSADQHAGADCKSPAIAAAAVADEDDKKQKQQQIADCCICLDCARDTVFLPCAHLACCAACAGKVAECPVCRALVVRLQRVIVS